MTYRPPYFRVDDQATLLELIAQHPLATFVSSHDGALSLTYLPMLARHDGDRLLLEGHIARSNDHWRHEATAALAAFRIASHYISPTWYPSRQRDPRVVPTYDYVAVEARGPVRFIHDRAWLGVFTWRLSEDQERRHGGTWKPEDAPREYMETELSEIVGVEMVVEALLGTFKLNQNHPQENLREIHERLSAAQTPEATQLASFVRFNESDSGP